jgi:hypothetical protein
LITHAGSPGNPRDEAIGGILAELEQIELMACMVREEVDALTVVGAPRDVALSLLRDVLDTMENSMDQLEAELRAFSR